MAAGVDYLLRQQGRLGSNPGFGAGSVPVDNSTHPIEPTFLVASANTRAAIRNVADFVCDGIDDKVEIRAAFDALGVYGGRVFLTEGEFDIFGDTPEGNGAMITMPVNSSLIGVGPGTVLNIDSRLVGTEQFGLRLDTHCEVADLKVQVVDTSDALIGILTLGSFAHIHNCWFVGMASSGSSDVIYVTVDNDGLVNTCTFEGIAGVAIDVDGATVTNSAFKGNSGIAVNIVGSDAIVSNNRILDVDDGIYVSGGDNVVTGNHIDSIGDDGIYVVSDDNVITGNRIVSPGGDGIELTGTADRNVVQLNHITGAGGLSINDGGVNTIWGDIDSLIWTMSQTLTVKTGLLEIPFGVSAEIIEIEARLSIQPTGSSVIVDVNKNGTTMYTTQGNRPTIATSTNTDTTTPDITAIADNDYLSVDVDQKDSNDVGQNLTVTIRFRRT
jgi:parallel beta-helix repeat protein